MSEVTTGNTTSKRAAGFPTTQWTPLARWGELDEPARNELLASFYARYRAPLLNYILARGVARQEADDVLHDFTVEQMSGRLFSAASASRGRFRNLLLTALGNFLSSRHRAAAAQKRSPAGGMAYLDEEVTDGITWTDVLVGDLSPAQAYERTWLFSLLVNTLEALEADYTQRGQSTHIALLRARIINPVLTGSTKPAMSELAPRFGLTAVAASNQMVTVKRAYRRALCNEIATYVATEKEVSQELNEFFAFMQSFNRG